MKTLFALTAALLAAAPALATGKMTCATPKASWQPQAALVESLTKAGWQVRKAKVDGGCYEVYGTMPDGARVEAYFDPASFEQLYVEQRGKVIFKKAE